MEDASHHLDASALNLVVAGESNEDPTVFCDISETTATTDFHTVRQKPPAKLCRIIGNKIQVPTYESDYSIYFSSQM